MQRLSGEFGNNKQERNNFTAGRNKHEITTKGDINSGNTHSDIVAISNLQKLLLNLTSEISGLQKYVTDELYGLNKTVDRIRTDQSNKKPLE